MKKKKKDVYQNCRPSHITHHTYKLRQFGFICTLCYPVFHLTKISCLSNKSHYSPFYIQIEVVCMYILVKPISLSRTVFYVSPVVLFKPKYSYFSKSQIASPTYPKMGQSSPRIVHSTYLINTFSSHSHLSFTHKFNHALKQCF